MGRLWVRWSDSGVSLRMPPFADDFLVNRLRYLDLPTAMEDVREAHTYVSSALLDCHQSSVRQFCLTEERKRLAAIAWQIKKRLEP